MDERNAISWTTAISVDGGEDAVTLFNGMTRDGVLLNKVTFATLMSPCRRCQQGTRRGMGHMIYTVCLKTGVSNKVAASNSLLLRWETIALISGNTDRKSVV